MSVSPNLLPANTSGIETDTSGWQPGPNTTLSRSTARFYSGAASLQMTATAAGSVQTTTPARVAVTPGTVYSAYAYFANVAAASGRVATVRVDWWTGVTGGVAISSVVSAGKTLANDTAWASNTPPPILVATAPATAAYASVTLTVTGMTAGSAVLADVISFGLPLSITDNLLPYTTQGVEVDASEWSSLWNATVGLTATTSFEGWRALTLTSTATGAIRGGTVAAYPVTAGVEYHAYAWVYSPIANGEFHPVVRWYDSTGAQIGTSSQTWTGLAASTWTRCAVIDTAPAGATTARLVLEPVATATGQVWIFDQMALRPSPLISGTLLGYNAQSAEVDASAWSASSGCTLTRTTSTVWEGIAALTVTCTGGADAVIRLVKQVPVTPRQAYKVVPRIYRLATAPTVVDLLFTWYTADGVAISESFARWTMGTAEGWYAPTGSAVAPANAASLSVGLRFNSPPGGTVYTVDYVFLGAGGLGVIADVLPDDYGVSVQLQGLTTGSYTYWGLWRMLPDGSMTPVRGSSGDLSKVTVTGDVAVAEDFEAPLGESLAYYLKLWTTSGTGYMTAASDSVMIPEPDETLVVIKDPGLPARRTTAVVAKGGMPDWTRNARQGVNPVRGRARPIVISDVRTSRTGTIQLVTETQGDIEQMWWLLETGNTLLLQWPASMGEADIYVQIGDVTEARIAEYASYSDRTWSIPLTEVDRPVGGMTGSPARTWQDVNDGFADWLDVMNAHDNWLDVYTGVQGG